MKVQNIRAIVGRWLRAERQGREAEAERSLRAVFELVPVARLDALFADRVLARIALMPVPAAVRIGLERLAAAVLVTTALALWVLPWWVAPIWGRVPRIDWAGMTGLAARSLSRWIVEAASVWEWMAAVGRLSQLALGHPTVISAILLCSLLAAMASRLLQSLLTERSTTYAKS